MHFYSKDIGKKKCNNGKGFKMLRLIFEKFGVATFATVMQSNF